MSLIIRNKIKMHNILLKVFILCLFLTKFALAEDDKLVGLTTLEWPPYEEEALKDKGAHSLVTKEAFAAMGYKVHIGVFPWKRAIDNVRHSKEYIGYFTEYYSDENAKEFYYSDPIGEAPIGLVERKESPIKWNNFSDLEKYEIGVTDGYINTPELDNRILSGKIKAQVVTEDINGVKKVLAGRVSASVIDPNVFNYFLATDPSLHGAKDKIQFNSKILDIKKHYICFRKSPEGLKMMQIFNEGLKKINSKEVVENYFKENGYIY